MLMDYDPEYSLKSNAELNACLTKYAEEHEQHSRAAGELSRREKAAEEKMDAQFARAVFWGRLAAILALPGALYVLWQIVRSLH
jgi:single-stranded DNA-binding protein